jgi:serine/threonine-protein kinase
MMVGHPPFRGSEIGHQQVNSAVPLPGPGQRPIPDFLKKVILRCLMKEKSDRYDDARAVLDELKLVGIVPGMVVAGRYEVLAEVGHGGMGSVFRARDVELDETVALKFVRGTMNAEIVARFIQEIKSSRCVTHPNVVRVFTFEKWHEHRFIVMEYIAGPSMYRWIDRAPAPTLQDRLKLALSIASAIAAAHRVGIIHRDIKPENILVTETGQPKILDFGIARMESAERQLTAENMIVGSPKYMSPEQIQAKAVDRRTDIYSLGVVLYYLFTGVEPFAGKDVQEILVKHLTDRPPAPHAINPDIPPHLSEAIMRAMDPDPDRRFPSTAALADALKGRRHTNAA